MNNWFECKIKYDKTGEDGIIKSTSESYLIDAVNFTEAEKRIIVEMKPFVSAELLVANIKRVKIAEMFDSSNASADKWYRARVNMMAFDEEKNVEKKIPYNMYVKAENIQEALSNLLTGLKTSLGDYETVSIVETSIMDVYHQELVISE